MRQCAIMLHEIQLLWDQDHVRKPQPHQGKNLTRRDKASFNSFRWASSLQTVPTYSPLAGSETIKSNQPNWCHEKQKWIDIHLLEGCHVELHAYFSPLGDYSLWGCGIQRTRLTSEWKWNYYSVLSYIKNPYPFAKNWKEIWFMTFNLFFLEMGYGGNTTVVLRESYSH